MRKRPWVIGLIGGIGSGKSTVAELFREQGAEVLSADAVVHAVLDRPGVRRALLRTWGAEVAPKGRVDRARVARLAFRDADSVKRLNAIVHPHVRRDIRKAISGCRQSVFVLDAPLLLEAGGADWCDRIVFVDAPAEVRLRRIRSRGWDRGELRRRERCQWPLKRKKRMAHTVIRNRGSRAAAARQVRTVLRELGQNSHP